MPKLIFNRSIWLIIALIVAVAAGTFAVKSYRQTKVLNAQIEELKRNQQQVSAEETLALMQEVSKVIALPEGETPTVATITDKEKLAKVPFFEKAMNGDKVLIYVNARKTFLYRPSEKRVIEVATLTINVASEDFAGKIAIRNGSSIGDLAQRFSDSLVKRLPKVEVVSREERAASAYTETLIIDLTGTRGEDAQKLAGTIGGRVATLPANEPRPEGAEFLVILGVKTTGSTSPVTSPSPSPSVTP